MKMNRDGIKTHIGLIAITASLAASGAFADSSSQTGVTSVERVAHSIALEESYSGHVSAAGNKWGTLAAGSHASDAKHWARIPEKSGFKWNTAPFSSEADEASDVISAESKWTNTSDAAVQGYKWGVRNDADQTGYKWGVR